MIRGGQGGGGQAECTALMVFAQPDGQVRWEFKSFQEIFFPTKNAVGGRFARCNANISAFVLMEVRKC